MNKITRIEVVKYGQTIEVAQSWVDMIKYVKNDMGGYGEMTIKFKDGLPYEAEIVKKTIRF